MRTLSHLRSVNWEGLRHSLDANEFRALTSGALRAAAASGEAIMVQRSEAGEESSEIPEVAAVAAMAASGEFETALPICPGMTVSNSPRADRSGMIANFTPVATVQGVSLARNPTHGACLSSGFGQRGERQHKGVDLHAAQGGPILAGGDGVIAEMYFRDDYGNMLLIDHGNGVFTRYAHLSSFRRGLAVGTQVHSGEMIGLMGNTASYPVPIHLHYEVLLGDYANPRGSFGLVPYNLLAPV